MFISCKEKTISCREEGKRSKGSGGTLQKMAGVRACHVAAEIRAGQDAGFHKGVDEAIGRHQQGTVPGGFLLSSCLGFPQKAESSVIGTRAPGISRLNAKPR